MHPALSSFGITEGGFVQRRAQAVYLMVGRCKSWKSIFFADLCVRVALQPSPPCRASRRGYMAAQLRNNSCFIFGDDASQDAPKPDQAQRPSGRRQPPGGTSSFSVGW